MADRVIVFVDYQNVYRGARSTFHQHSDASWAGQIDPLRLGQIIIDKSLGARDLAQVRVYRGRPDASKDPRTYSAHMRQSVAQERADQHRVKVITRALRYPPDWPTSPAQEKGIDVALATDFVIMAVRGDYDVGVIVSTDTDLKPALEAVISLGGKPRCEVAAFTNPTGYSRRLSVKGAHVWCHWLDEAEYRVVADSTDYNKPPD